MRNYCIGRRQQAEGRQGGEGDTHNRHEQLGCNQEQPPVEDVGEDSRRQGEQHHWQRIGRLDKGERRMELPGCATSSHWAPTVSIQFPMLLKRTAIQSARKTGFPRAATCWTWGNLLSSRRLSFRGQPPTGLSPEARASSHRILE